MGKDITRFSVRFEIGMYKQLEKISKEEFLTVNTLIKQVIQKKLKQIKKEN